MKMNKQRVEIDVEKSPQRASMTKTLGISGYLLVFMGIDDLMDQDLVTWWHNS